MRIRYPAAILFMLAINACSSGKSSASASNESDADQSAMPASDMGSNNGSSARLASIKPCDLLTDDEIASQVDLTYEKGQRDAMHQMSVKHQISKEEDRAGRGPSCHISWHSVTPGGDERAKGAFDLKVMTANDLKALEGMARPKSGARAAAISGVGDEAFYLEYAPSARVGDLAVSVAEFPDTHDGNGGVALLRAAAGRLK